MKLGNVYAIRKVGELMRRNRQFKDEIDTALSKYIHNDWGYTCPEDAELSN